MSMTGENIILATDVDGVEFLAVMYEILAELRGLNTRIDTLSEQFTRKLPLGSWMGKRT